MLQFGVKGIRTFGLMYRILNIPSITYNSLLCTDLCRYFVITDSKLVYYLAMDRSVMKGELVLAGVNSLSKSIILLDTPYMYLRGFLIFKAMAKESSTRASSRNAGFYFTVSHPQCGVRELCAKTDNRRQQWVRI